MKFLYKLLLWNIVILAVSLSVGGYIFVNFVFNTSMEREINQAMEESNILQFAFETAALNIPSRYDVLQDTTIEEIGLNLENSGHGSGRLLRLSNESRQPLYSSNGFVSETDFLQEITKENRIYKVLSVGEHYYVQTGIQMNVLNRTLYLETMKDVTQVYHERSEGFAVYRKVILWVLGIATVVLFIITSWLTKPIRLLTKAARKMTAGDYSYRAKVISDDEMGQLTEDFNKMANALEENINELEEGVKAREDFIAAFSHELKTPLTAIIGYADMLRSRKLDEEKHFLSANYIYTEGKRLEAMSFRLLDLIVTKRTEIEKNIVSTDELFGYLRELFGEHPTVRIHCEYESANIKVEENLLKSVLLNLVDNACKASKDGGKVEIYGHEQENGYLFTVKDYGVGIPKEECKKITEAFYMVDKSRSRSKNGAGLGLALCVAILSLHGSELIIESEVEKGSCFSFLIPREEVTMHEKAM